MSLIALYKLDDLNGSGLVPDSSGNGLDGTANGGSFVTGKIGNAFDNEGNSRILVPYNAMMHQTQMTMSLWFNSDTINYTSNAYILGQYDYATNKRKWSLFINSATDTWMFAISPDGTSSGVVYHEPEQSVETGWHHVAATWNNTTKLVQFYYDGEFVTSEILSTGYSDVESFLTLGGLAASNYGDGLMDDTRICDEVLSPGQIGSLYNGGDGTELAYPWRNKYQHIYRRILSEQAE